MNPSRRKLLALGGSSLAALVVPLSLRAQTVALIEMRGTARGEHVWFSPMGIAVVPSTTLRFVNRDPANSHTATCYHPLILERGLRIPARATPFDSDFLLPGESFEVTLDVPGVYDFYCQPHEHAGMVGRIVVGKPGVDAGWQDAAPITDDLPEPAATAFPAVQMIIDQGQVMPKDAE